ncbi:NAD(P)/FAD-dependent oxidoreductase [Arthrobacter sp. MDT2-2]
MRTTVVVGAGAAGITCAKHLRELDDARTIIVIDKDPDVPYERPPLSKALTGTGAGRTGTDELTRIGIDLVFGTAEGIDLAGQVLHTSGGDVEFDDLVLAPGSTPNRPDWMTDQVHELHSLADSHRLRHAVHSAESAVVVGGGFVGAELAASLVSARVPTTFVFQEDALFHRRLGQAASKLLTQLHVDAGVRLLPGRRVLDVTSGRPIKVRLTDGTSLEADLVVAGVGARPDTAWLTGTGLLGLDGTIQTDASLNTSAASVTAAGDCVSWRTPDGHVVRSAHWTTARSHGRHLAADLARDTRTPFLEAPYFWSMQHGNLLQGIGHVDPQRADIEVRHGDGPRPSLIALYRVDGRLVGAVAINFPQAFMAARAEVELLSTSAHSN